ncbi:SGNH/GDSL hydrolase family protein [Sinorhizobium meliloti]|nr:SGNH/GDSL hydrolase family protein [Sinorhizobium meliloti]WQP28876.1 SGNH/GDSL hydrolase family protein [Sinorhizobium meliloti]
MANEIRDAFAAAWPDGPMSDPVEPDKYVIRSIGPTIDTKIANTASDLQTQINEVELIAEAASVGLVQKGTWAQLSAIAGSANGQAGRVAGPDAGTHADPVVGGTVANEGEYAWSTSPAGWQRVGDLLVSKVAQVAASFHDNLGFVGMQLQTDGSLRQNPPEKSFEIGDTRSAAELLAVQDDRGFKALSLTATEFRAPGVSGGEDEGFNYGFDASPLIGGHLVAFDGAETHIYARNILPARSDISRVRASLYSEAATDGSRPSYSRLGDDELVVDLTNCDGTVYLQTRLDEVNPDIRHQATLSVITPPVAPGSLNTARVLMIGDSITNRQMAARMNAAAAAKGYTLTFVGTLNGAGIGQISSDVTGPLGEGREGWEFGDFTYAVTDRVSIVAPGDEATYLASDKATKQTKNPFLRVATGGDDPSVVRNGNVFDFDFYLDRFTLADPHVVFIGLGTNDIRDLNSPDLGPAITDGLTIMCGQIQAARPGTKIVIWFPPVSRSSDRDTLWSEYVEVLSRLIKFVRGQADEDIRLLPTWAMASQEVGFALDTGSTSDLGIQTASLSDTVHLSAFNIARVSEVLAAAAAAVAQGTL